MSHDLDTWPIVFRGKATAPFSADDEDINWSKSTLSQNDAIDGIESDTWSFFVRRGGHVVNAIVSKSRYGHKYLKTVADGDQPDNLLALSECR
jgi:Protein of unknown function (DUF3892)